MRLPRHWLFIASFFCLTFILPIFCAAQKQSRANRKTSGNGFKKFDRNALVINERFSVIRLEPSLYAVPVQRVGRGQTAVITGEKQADGVTFMRVLTSTRRAGWIQKEAFLFPSQKGEDGRLADLINASEGFDRLELITIFLENFPNSLRRPPILLQTGDLLEEAAQRLTTEANRRTTNEEIRLYATTLRSIFLNYNGLDRYRKLGFGFVFNENTRRFHYDGVAWREIVGKFPDSKEFPEAKRKLDALYEKMKNNSLSNPQ